eukprot:COSAG02_NODE_29276_length_572_cov_1.306554_2_plen_117_part_01
MRSTARAIIRPSPQAPEPSETSETPALLAPRNCAEVPPVQRNGTQSDTAGAAGGGTERDRAGRRPIAYRAHPSNFRLAAGYQMVVQTPSLISSKSKMLICFLRGARGVLAAGGVVAR